MNNPLMPKSTAVWLIDNTALTFEQISKFCNLHILEVQGIADGEVAVGIQGKNPITSGELTSDEIKRCEKDD
ncbi:MAG: cytoplasmic protein, partial [Pelagibacterales bacterium]